MLLAGVLCFVCLAVNPMTLRNRGNAVIFDTRGSDHFTFMLVAVSARLHRTKEINNYHNESVEKPYRPTKTHFRIVTASNGAKYIQKEMSPTKIANIKSSRMEPISTNTDLILAIVLSMLNIDYGVWVQSIFVNIAVGICYVKHWSDGKRKKNAQCFCYDKHE